MSDLPDWALAGRSGWRWTGETRPPWADTPGPGQESVWDYPRPPQLEADSRHVVVMLGDTVIADTHRAHRVLETSHPPSFYLPRDDVRMEHLRQEAGLSRCEWKGEATYWSVVTPDGRVLSKVGWAYDRPFPEFGPIRGYLSFYPAALECYVDDQRVQPQAGGFYGGWVTPELVGPFKGEPGSAAW